MEKPSEQMVQAITESNVKSVQEFLEVLSVEAVYNLLKNFSGMQLTVPKFDSFLKTERNKRIIDDYYKGFTLNELARRYNLSSRQITLIINKAMKKPNT